MTVDPTPPVSVKSSHSAVGAHMGRIIAHALITAIIGIEVVAALIAAHGIVYGALQ